MYVCICKAVTDKHIYAEIENGAMSYQEVRDKLGIGTCCGRCKPEAKQLIDDEVASLLASLAYAA